MGYHKSWRSFLKPAVNVAAPFIGKAVAAKVKTLRLGRLQQTFRDFISREGFIFDGRPQKLAQTMICTSSFQLNFNIKNSSSIEKYELMKKCSE